MPPRMLQSIRTLPGGSWRRMAPKVPVRALGSAHARAGTEVRSGVTKPLPKEVGMTLCAARRFRFADRYRSGLQPVRRLRTATRSSPAPSAAWRVRLSLHSQFQDCDRDSNDRRHGQQQPPVAARHAIDQAGLKLSDRYPKVGPGDGLHIVCIRFHAATLPALPSGCQSGRRPVHGAVPKPLRGSRCVRRTSVPAQRRAGTLANAGTAKQQAGTMSLRALAITDGAVLALIDGSRVGR